MVRPVSSLVPAIVGGAGGRARPRNCLGGLRIRRRWLGVNQGKVGSSEVWFVLVWILEV